MWEFSQALEKVGLDRSVIAVQDHGPMTSGLGLPSDEVCVVITHYTSYTNADIVPTSKAPRQFPFRSSNLKATIREVPRGLHLKTDGIETKQRSDENRLNFDVGG